MIFIGWLCCHIGCKYEQQNRKKKINFTQFPFRYFIFLIYVGGNPHINFLNVMNFRRHFELLNIFLIERSCYKFLYIKILRCFWIALKKHRILMRSSSLWWFFRVSSDIQRLVFFILIRILFEEMSSAKSTWSGIRKKIFINIRKYYEKTSQNLNKKKLVKWFQKQCSFITVIQGHPLLFFRELSCTSSSACLLKS